jgi:hypothetical protein
VGRRNLTRLLESEANKLADELQELSSPDAEPDHPWSNGQGERGPTPLETNLGRKIAIFRELSRYEYQRANVYLRTMALSGALGTDRVMAMLREIEGMQEQKELSPAEVQSRGPGDRGDNVHASKPGFLNEEAVGVPDRQGE